MDVADDTAHDARTAATPGPSAPEREGATPWRRDVRRRRLLAGADALAVAATVGSLGLASSSEVPVLAGIAVAVLVGLALAKALGLYDRDHRVLDHTTVDEAGTIVSWSALLSVLTLAALRTTEEVVPSASVLVLLLVGLCALDLGLRAAARQLWRQTTPPERIVIVGSGPQARAAERKFGIFGDLHVDLLGTVDERDAFAPGGLRAGSTFARLTALAGGVDRILISAAAVEEQVIAELLPYCRHHQIKLGLVPPTRGMLGTAVVLDHLAELPIIQYNTWDVPRTTMFAKRVMDIAISGAGLLALAPLVPFVVLAIKLDSPGPAFFRQLRGGQGGTAFRMVKFRTMVVDAEARLGELVDTRELDALVFKFEDDPRITRLGRLLRRTSLDEIPQLWNVLWGHMSVVGPRPEQLDLVRRYPPEVAEVRLAVKPGLTGPMQVSGRGALTMEERLAVEREYVENLSIGRDVRIMGRTLTAVVRARGAY